VSVVLPVFSFALGSLGAWIVARSAGKFFSIDRPSERSSHSLPTPRGGGVGLLVAFFVVAVVSDLSPWFWGPLTSLSLMAAYGDIVELPARPRLCAQLGLVGIFILGTWQPTSNIYLSSLLVPFWVILIVGTANFYNFMDGINGIAGITGAVGFSLLAFYMYNQGGQTTLVSLSLCMAFSCLGFLPFNMPKAKVFMGDIGSILLGAVFAGLVYLASHTVLDFVCMASFLFTFYADELCTMAVRLKGGEDLTRPHRRHVYQLLANERRVAHWRISIGYGTMQVLVGACVLLAKPFGIEAVLAVLLGWFGLFLVGAYYVRAGLEPADSGVGAPWHRRSSRHRGLRKRLPSRDCQFPSKAKQKYSREDT